MHEEDNRRKKKTEGKKRKVEKERGLRKKIEPHKMIPDGRGEEGHSLKYREGGT